MGKKIKELLSESNESSRREFMKTAGKLAIFTPPAIMLLTRPSRACITNSPGLTSSRDKTYSSFSSFGSYDGPHHHHRHRR